MAEQSVLKHRPVVLAVLDGWGVSVPSRANAITQARAPFWDSLLRSYPATTLQASGEATGLPWGESGNSEVGHMNIGAGRIVYQELTRIHAAIRTHTFQTNKAFQQIFSHVKKSGGTLHIVGLVSTGGVHSHSDHLYALLEAAKSADITRLALHAILDGRDTPYASGIQHIERLQEYLKGTHWRVATLSGRFYAMDRDNHWDRIQAAYQVIARGEGKTSAASPVATIKKSYDSGIYDENFVPTILADDEHPPTTVQEGDGLLFFNIRADRMRQIVSAFCNPDFAKFEHHRYASLAIVTATQYDAYFPVSVAFPPQSLKNCLAEYISAHKLKQLHTAETEKYAHITYFLNGGREEPYPGEKRVMVPSPAVESYAKKPEMSAHRITDVILSSIQDDEYDFIACNFANADMVGHTGDMNATIRAIETMDECFKRIIPAVLQKGGALLITADHGNAEQLLDLQTGTINKEHSNNPVPCIIIARDLEGKSLDFIDPIGRDLSVIEPSGLLSDVAPTILDLLGLDKPKEMTGRSLIEK
ncbi:2,3-bisphosphoglycerate-independent phosphoglycerate mutase [Candidatus Uhrbacteria bacterium]|nr:2,3-bisphosphoglycerate-independent phosphoglycerate mutase [Candidatus Uhrbacteria bacterium]